MIPTNASMRRDLRRLLIAQVPADFSDWLDLVAVGALLAYVWTVPPIVFAVLAFSYGLPYLLVGPFAGVLVDRFNLNRVLVLSNLGRGFFTATLFLAPNWIVLMLLIVVRGSVDTFFTPAKQGAIQALTTEDNRMRANGRSHAINQASKIVAPAIGGSLLIWFDPHDIFLVNAGVSLIAVALVMQMHPIVRQEEPEDEEEPGMMQKIRSGLAEVQGHAVLNAALTMMAAGYFAMFFYDMLILPLTRILGFSETVLGMTLAAVGAGGVLGSLALGETKRPFVWISAGAGVSSAMVFVLGYYEVSDSIMTLALYIAIFGILGVCKAVLLVPFRTIIQNAVSPNRIGRVTALSEAINTVALLTAPFIGAAIATIWTVGMSFICGAVLMLGMSIAAFRLRNKG